jgi:flagellar biosynthesis component FlhA
MEQKEKKVMRKDANIAILLGYGFVVNVNTINELVDNLLTKKIQILRKRLKNDFNIDMPIVHIMDSLQLSKTEIALKVEDEIVWQYDFTEVDLLTISDAIISELKQVQLSDA